MLSGMPLNAFEPSSDVATVRKVASSRPEIATYLTFKQLRDYGVTYSRSHLWLMYQRGEFPRPIAPTPRRRLWRLSEVLCWLDNAPRAAPIKKRKKLTPATATKRRQPGRKKGKT